MDLIPAAEVASLEELVAMEVVDAPDAEVARSWARLAGESNPAVVTATAIAVHAVRQGSVCVDVAMVGEFLDVTDLAEQLAASALVGSANGARTPLLIDANRLYLARYWAAERQVARHLDGRLVPAASNPRWVGGSGALALNPEQETAVTTSLRSPLSIIAGGPGTGKTTVVTTVVAALHEVALASGERDLRVALVAPTGKAAARLGESVSHAAGGFPDPTRSFLQGLQTSTVHRLLGYSPPGGPAFRHHARHPLRHDVVIVDEASMVSLTLMRHLLEALAPQTRLILVGDPDQLTSVEAGAVLGDLVRRYRDREPPVVTHLKDVHRFGRGIADLAGAVRRGESDAALAALERWDELELISPDDVEARVAPLVVRAGQTMIDAAMQGEIEAALAGLERHRVLCARRTGPLGVSGWLQQIEEWMGLRALFGGRPPTWYPGRPLLNQANDQALGLYNGDTGVVVSDAEGNPFAAFGTPSAWKKYAVSRLGQIETTRAMSVHRSQGSQFDVVSVVLPERGSKLLTRELLYTAVTRASERVQIIGSEAELREALGHPISRASGLAQSVPEPKRSND